MQWTITEEHRQEMAAFFADFWQMIKASYEIPQEPQANAEYWRTLITWSDELMKKYSCNPVISRLVISYIDAQTEKQQDAAGNRQQEAGACKS